MVTGIDLVRIISSLLTRWKCWLNNQCPAWNVIFENDTYSIKCGQTLLRNNNWLYGANAYKPFQEYWLLPNLQGYQLLGR